MLTIWERRRLEGVIVTDEDINRALGRRTNKREPSSEMRERARENIAIGKAAGSYDKGRK